MCASTRCPLSSSTRNMAFGNGSVTVPSTRIASSLGFASELTTSSSGNRHFGRTALQENGAGVGPERAKQARRRPARLHHVGWPLPGEREDLGAVVADGDGVLEVGRTAGVGR